MTNKNRSYLTYISFLSYALTGSFITVTGVVIQGLSVYFNISTLKISIIFTILNIGMLSSIFLNAWLMKIIPLKKQLYIGFFSTILSILGLIIFKNIYILLMIMFIFGLISGVTMSIGTFLITSVYFSRERAKKLLITDSFFSFSGMIFPSICTFILFHKMYWQWIYVWISLIYLLIFLLSLNLSFPIVEKSHIKILGNITFKEKEFNLNIFLLYCSALMYILGQMGFISWVPEYGAHNLKISMEKSGKLVSNFWMNYMLGMWFFSSVIQSFKLQKIIIFLTGISALMMFLFIFSWNYIFSLFIISFLGFFSSSIYSILITIASMQTDKPSPKIINFILLAGSLGTFLTYIITSPIVYFKGPIGALIFANILYFIIFYITILLRKMHLKKKLKEF
ncbi:MFS transporter TsgA [Buchnera aphidicola]|uniref:MFS transporter TsgA n=1 Tax=Buchnera aphidicola TaxID=9 RepID=UPI0030EB8969